jgi:hypothetical protein
MTRGKAIMFLGQHLTVEQIRQYMSEEYNFLKGWHFNSQALLNKQRQSLSQQGSICQTV